MLVKKWMTKEVITVNADDSMQHAIHILKEHKLRLLPVMDKGELVGIISDGDLKKASPSDATSLDIHELIYLTSKIKIKDLMKKNPFRISPDTSAEEAAAIMLEKRISGLPVTDACGKLVGIITKSDIFRLLISLTCLAGRGIQIAIQLDDSPGSIKEMRDIVHRYKGRTASVLSSTENSPEGKINVYLRIYDIDRTSIQPIIDEMRKYGKPLYVIDHRDNTRQIFES